jgi:hypothetical protein
MRLAWPAAMDAATPSDKPPDRPVATASGERWVTLRELAEARGISLHSAARLVRRHRWRRQTDNGGHVRALVPVEALDKPAERPGAMPADSPGAGPALIGELTAALEPVVALLNRQIEQANGRADRAEAALTAERGRADALRDRLAAAEADRDRARAQAHTAQDELRQADAARRARGRWARLRAAWRGE